MTGDHQPSLGFISIDSGGRAAQPPSQSEILAGLFAGDGFEVRSASSVRSPALRTGHQVVASMTWRTDVSIISVYSGRSFLYADLASRITARRRSSKVVLVLHGGGLPGYGVLHPDRVRRALDRADLIVAPSGFLAEEFRTWGYPVSVIPNVLALDEYEYLPRPAVRPALLWMRTFHEHYDPMLAIDVIHKVAASRPDVRLTMGGADHGLLDEVRDRITLLGIDDQVHIAGYLDSEGKRQAFRDHDLFLNTNRVDNMPVSVLEAAACGLVPVATRVGGIPHLLTHDVDSLLVPAGDAEAMARQVTSVIEDASKFTRLRAGARQLAMRSAWPSVKKQWLDELARL